MSASVADATSVSANGPEKSPAGSPLRTAHILILAGLLASKLLLYVAVIPPWQVPDEPTHFEYAYLLFRQKTLFEPVRPDPVLQREIIESMAEFRFWSFLPGGRPATLPRSFGEDPFLRGAPSQISLSQPLYYWLGSLWLRIFPPKTLLDALYLLRLYSALQVLLFFLVLAFVAHRAVPHRKDLQLIALAFVVFLPQLSATGAGVNSDSAVILTYALTLAVCLMLIQSRRRLWEILLLPAILLCVLSKRTGLAAVPLGLGALLLSRPWTRRALARTIGLPVAFGAVLVLAHAVLTWFSPDTARKVVSNVAYAWTRLTATNDVGMGGEESLTLAISMLWQSFWARFGWLTVGPPSWLYLPNIGVLTLAALGAWKGVLSSVSPQTDGSPETGRAQGLIALSGALILLAVLMRNLGDFQPQGRYLLPGLPAYAVWLSNGIAMVPGRWQPFLPVVLIGWLSFFDLATLVKYAVPGFYGGVL